jgi:hypothetical protein
VIGVDGSAGSLEAVQFTAHLLDGLDASVTAVVAQEPFAEWVPATDPQSWRRTALDHLRT